MSHYFSFLKKEFILQKDNPEVAETAKIVIQESRVQSAKAEAVLREYTREDLENVISLTFCAILLHSGIRYVSRLVDRGLLRDDEAEHWVHHISEELDAVVMCTDSLTDYPGYKSVEFIEPEEEDTSTSEANPVEPLV